MSKNKKIKVIGNTQNEANKINNIPMSLTECEAKLNCINYCVNDAGNKNTAKRSKWIKTFLFKNSISILALVVAIIALFPSFQQIDLSKKQADISIKKELPSISVKFGTDYGKLSASNNDAIIDIVNSGGMMSNLQYEIITFLHLIKNNSAYEEPIAGIKKFYNMPYKKINDRQYQIRGENSNFAICDLNSRYQNINRINDNSSGLNVISMIKISYLDIFNNQHTEYFYTNVEEPLSVNIWNDRYSKFKNFEKTDNVYDIDKITIEKINELIKLQTLNSRK